MPPRAPISPPLGRRPRRTRVRRSLMMPPPRRRAIGDASTRPSDALWACALIRSADDATLHTLSPDTPRQRLPFISRQRYSQLHRPRDECARMLSPSAETITSSMAEPAIAHSVPLRASLRFRASLTTDFASVFSNMMLAASQAFIFSRAVRPKPCYFVSPPNYVDMIDEDISPTSYAFSRRLIFDEHRHHRYALY